MTNPKETKTAEKVRDTWSDRDIAVLREEALDGETAGGLFGGSIRYFAKQLRVSLDEIEQLRTERDGIRRLPISERLELIGCSLAENVMFRVEDDGTFTIGEKVAAEVGGE